MKSADVPNELILEKKIDNQSINQSPPSLCQVKSADVPNELILEKKIDTRGATIGQGGEVWLFLESAANYHNADVQSLLHSMKAEDFPLQARLNQSVNQSISRSYTP